MKHISNEQKAQQIIGCNRANCFECGGSLSVANGCTEFERIIAMAEWKDEQEVEFLQSLMFQVSTQQALNIIINNRIKLLKEE
jgi:hypothetical protein